MNNIMETKKVSKLFKNEKVLQNVSIQVKENAVYGLLGPNGAGKSTLLKLLTGAWVPTSGGIYFEGRKWQKSDLKYMGAMIDGPAIYPNLTAYENLEVLCILLDLPKIRIQEVLEIVGLPNTGSKLTKIFSLGMKQRLGIAMALLNEPKLLILDEPTNGLDPIGIQELRALIRSLPGKGITVMISSHILSEIQQVADTIGIIFEGQLRYEAPNDKEKEDLEELFMTVAKKEKGEQR